MATTAGQKFAALCMPLAAFGLAYATADPSWSPRREQYGSWREARLKAAEEMARAKEPVPGPEAAPVPAEAKPPAPPKEGPPPKPAEPKPAEPAQPKPALPQPGGIEFKVGGLPSSRSGEALKFPAAERLEVTVAVSGALKAGTTFADLDTVKEAMGSAPDSMKANGLLFLVPNGRSPWKEVGDLLNAGSAAGWSRIGIAVAHPDNPGLARVLPVQVPAGPVDLPKGQDAMTVKVGTGAAPSFDLNGEACKDAATLEAKAKALHDDCEVMTEGYSADLGKTPWTVDASGSGTMVGGVVAALDALARAGVRTVRIAGVQKPTGEEEKK